MMFDQFFWCDTYGQRMAKSVCVAQQKRAQVKGASRARSPERCRNCDQGREIRAELEQPVTVEES